MRGLIYSVSIPWFRYYLLRWIVRRYILFIEVEDKDFQALLIKLNTTIKPYLVTRNSIRNQAENEFIEAQKQILNNVLGRAVSRIHILFDLWTSPNGYTICGIITHFISHQYANQSVLLTMKRLTGPYGGEDITKVIILTLQEYKVMDRLSVFITDNTKLNNTAIREILY